VFTREVAWRERWGGIGRADDWTNDLRLQKPIQNLGSCERRERRKHPKELNPGTGHGQSLVWEDAEDKK